MNVTITDYFCFPLEIGGKLVADIEGRADFEVRVSGDHSAIVRMDNIFFQDILARMNGKEEYVYATKPGLELDLEAAVRAYYVDGPGHKGMLSKLELPDAVSLARAGDAESRAGFMKGE